MSDHFNELLLQTLKEVGIRLERLEGRSDHVINEKADKIDVKDLKTELNAVKTELKTDINDLRTELKTDINDLRTELKTDINDLRTELNAVKTELKTDVNALKTEINDVRDELRSQGQRIDRIETGIKTLQWTMTAGLAALGIIIALIKAF